jgi:hypothetical protein
VLAVELQVEAPQRLTGPVDDLLDGKVGAALFDDDRLRGVEEALNALCPRSFAVLMDRSTARCFQAGSSLGFVTGGSVDCRVGRT